MKDQKTLNQIDRLWKELNDLDKIIIGTNPKLSIRKKYESKRQEVARLLNQLGEKC
jgi:hypothetical protein